MSELRVRSSVKNASFPMLIKAFSTLLRKAHDSTPFWNVSL